MRRAGLTIALAAAVVACGEDDPPSAPVVTVMKEVPAQGPAEGCFATVAGEDPAQELGLPAPCAGNADRTLVGGVDRVQLVIDYGADVPFAATATVPPPTVVMTVDGREASAGITVGTVKRVGARAYFLATLTTPATPSRDVRFVVTVAPGFGADVAERFEITPPPVAIAVLDCPPDAACELSPTRGAARVRVTVPGVVPQQVAVRSLLDGIPRADVIPPIATVVVGDHTEGETSLPIPAAVDGAVWSLEAQLGPVRSSSDPITLRAPAVATQLLECADAPACELTAAVGVATVRVTVPGPVPQQVALRSYVAGVPHPEAIPTVTTRSAGDRSEGEVIVPIPVAPGGATWWIEAELSGVRTNGPMVVLVAPSITSKLSCGASCTLPAGQTVALTVTAPANIRTKQATITTYLGGAPVLTGTTLNLTAIDVEAGTVAGVLSMPAPAAAGTWQIDASVGGYAAQTILATVEPAPAEPPPE